MFFINDQIITLAWAALLLGNGMAVLVAGIALIKWGR